MCTHSATEDSLCAVGGRREVNVPGVYRLQESSDTGNWMLVLGEGADIWWEVGVVRGGLMVKQRGAHIPWVFAVCPLDLALGHLTERVTLSAPPRPSDLAGLNSCRDIIWDTGMKNRAEITQTITELKLSTVSEAEQSAFHKIYLSYSNNC